MLVNKDRFVETVTHYAIDRVNNGVQREITFETHFNIIKQVHKDKQNYVF